MTFKQGSLPTLEGQQQSSDCSLSSSTLVQPPCHKLSPSLISIFSPHSYSSSTYTITAHPGPTSIINILLPLPQPPPPVLILYNESSSCYYLLLQLQLSSQPRPPLLLLLLLLSADLSNSSAFTFLNHSCSALQGLPAPTSHCLYREDKKTPLPLLTPPTYPVGRGWHHWFRQEEE